MSHKSLIVIVALGLISVAALVQGLRGNARSSRQETGFEAASSGGPQPASTPTATPTATPTTEMGLAITRCFGGVERDLDVLTQQLLQAVKFGPAILVQESYELIDSGGRKIVVQHSPTESDSVRVFDISATDGLPDARKNFPNSGAQREKRLKGALSLGRLVKKSVTRAMSSPDGRNLTVEAEGEKVVAVRYSSSGVDFDCSYERCRCSR